MKNLIDKLVIQLNNHRKAEWFRAAVIILVLVIFGVGANVYRNIRDTREMPEQEETSFLQELWDDSKLHISVFLSLSAALIIVQTRKNKLKQTGGKEER